MADKKAIVVLNIGAQRVGMARFKNAKGKLMLTDYESAEILADPAAASSRNAQIKMAVLELAQKMNVKNRVSYSVSGQSVFMRFVVLPDLDGVSKEELVTSEAQQNIPFSLDEVKWDWQEVAEVNGEKEVVIAAIKSKVLNDIQDAVEGAGMYTTEVDPSPMALYNAFKISYPDVNEPCMLIDVGAKTSNVVYIDGDRVFSRSIAIGGATVTTAIAKEYNVPFLEAENQKLSNGMVALDTRHTSKLDELTAALATCIRTSLNRMPAEISRTTNFYRSQQGGSAPKRVFLAGGGSNLPKITTFLQEKLRLPVEFFNPLRGVTLDKSIDLDELSKEAHLMGELVGLAARRASRASVELKLVPDSVQKEKDLDKRKSKLLIGAGGIVLGLMVYWSFGIFNNSNLTEQRDTLKKRYSEMKPFADEMQKFIDKEKSAVTDLDNLMSVQEARTQCTAVLNELKEVYSSKGYWFTEVTPLVNFDPEKLFSEAQSRIGTDKIAGGGPLLSESPSDIVNAIYIKGIWLDQNHMIAETTNRWLGRDYTEEEVKALNSGRPLPKEDPEGEQIKQGSTSKHFSRLLQFSSGGKLTFVNLGGDKMFDIKTRWDEGKLGSSFEMVLPLETPIRVKPQATNTTKTRGRK